MRNSRNTFNMYEDKIKKIAQGLWTIRCDQFSVEIYIGDFYRYLNQNELRALKTQIQLSINNNAFSAIKVLINNSKSKKDFVETTLAKIDNGAIQYYLERNNREEISKRLQLEFLYLYYKMKKYKKIIQYLNQQGINNFEKIPKQPFDKIEAKFKDFDNNFYSNPQTLTFSLQKLQSTTIRTIGNCIQLLNEKNKEDIFSQLLPYLNAISGQILTSDNLLQRFTDFVAEIQLEVLFDPAALGYNFCNYILAPPNVEFQTISNPRGNLYLNSIIDTIPELKRSIQNAFYSKNLLFFKVCRPSHCYHCIKSLPKLLTVNNRSCTIYFNEKSLIFCKNGGNFAEQIQSIPKSSAKDSESTSSSSVYFIIHPETLNDEDNSLLEEFINTRICYLNDTDLPKVIIISTIDFERSFSFFSAEFREIKFNINDTNEIEALFNLSMDSKFEFLLPSTFYLYKSEIPGSGKTYQIHKKMNQIKEEKHIENPPASIFIDANMKYLSNLDPNCDIYHFDLSPELFDEKFEFFDDLWILCNLYYHILPNGECVRLPKYVFFEVPTLTNNQHPEGGSIRNYDFPIAIENVVEVKATDSKVPLSDFVKNLCNLVFKPINGNEIQYTDDLLKIALKMFYPALFNDNSDEPCIDLRVINETNLFLNYFCTDLNSDTDYDLNLSKAIFLLLLRTNFHIWTMGNIFKNKNQPKSFIIMAHHSLFGTNTKEKWILLCFSSKDEQDQNKWDTQYLSQEIIDKIGNVSDSTLFQNDFFKIIEENKNINKYTNLHNFQENQIVFLKIVSSFFLVDPNKDSLYNNIIESSIISMYYDLYSKNNDVKNAVEYSLLGDKPDQSKYIKNNPDGLQSLNIILEILRKQTDYTNSSDLMKRLKKNKIKIEREKKKKYPIDSMILTVTLVKRFIIMILRIVLSQPLIQEGFTGVGKTAVVHLLNLLFDLAGHSLGWAFHQIDCHGDLLFENIEEDVIKTNIESSIVINCYNHIFFFDELNTSPGSCCVINYMNNYGMVQKLADNQNKITFIAAINPYIEVDKTTRDLSRVGIKQIIPTKLCKLRLCKIAPKDRSEFYETPDLNKLAYNVRELSESTKMIVLKSDPELFLLTENSNKHEFMFLPPDEKAVIKNMIVQYCNLLHKIIPKNDNYATIKKEINNYKEATINIIYQLLCESFLCIRQLMILRSILSYRDAKRFMMHFLNFFRKEIKHYFKDNRNINQISDFIKLNAIPNSIVYSLVLSIVLRFSSSTKIDKREIQNIRNRCNHLHFNIIMTEEDDYAIIDICSSLLQRLSNIPWKTIQKPEMNWIDKIINDFSSKIFNKYVNNTNIFKVKSLVIHLFAITSCFSVSRHFPEEPIMPCLIIGMPGTSKTLAIQLFTKHKSVRNDFYTTTYLSTRASEADGLNAHYRDCAMFMIEKANDINNPMAICVIDELGLANLNETRPLKLLHYYFDKGIAMNRYTDQRRTKSESKVIHVMSIAASNYALDFANMNRGILICTDLPTDDDISNSFSENTQQVKNFLKELWKLTNDRKRPEMLALRPLYLLYNVLFVNSRKLFIDVCIYLTSVISCHPSESVKKANKLISRLHLESKIEYPTIDDRIETTYIMSDVIKSFVVSEFLSRALCIRTKNYDCLDFIEDIITNICEDNNLNSEFHHIYPTDFKLPSHSCADHALKQIFKLITDVNVMPNTKNFFLIIGNASFSDSLLDLLNVPYRNKGDFSIGSSSLISQNGFSIKLNSLPRSFKLIFIMNDEDFEKRYTVDSFPLPLLDRFDQLYFDYKSEDEYEIIESKRKFRNEYSEYFIPDCEHIHKYFSHFIDKLSEVKSPSDDETNPVIIIEETEDEELPPKFVGNDGNINNLFNVCLYKYGENLKYKSNSRIIGKFKMKENEEDWRIIENTRNNVRKLKLKFNNAYFANHSRNNFYELEDNERKRIVINKLFKFNINTHDGTITELADYFQNNEDDEIKGFKAIVFTMSPMMEKLKGIDENNSIIIFDQYIQSAKSFDERINNDLKDETKYIIIQSNQFSSGSSSKDKSLVHDRHLRYLLSNPNYQDINLIIVYHLKDGILPEGMNTSDSWPIFWIESVSDSPMDANDSNKITKCILFRKEYRNNYGELAKNMLDQLYLDLWTSYNIILPNTLYPKLENEIKNAIFKEIINNEKRIQDEKEKNDDVDDFAFRSLFDSLKQDDTYKKIDLKRQFYEKLKNYMPSYLSFFIKLLISNTPKINQDRDNYLQFIKNLYEYEFIQKNFSGYYANQFQPFQVDEASPYFPELILEQVLILYDQQYTGSLCEIFDYISEYMKLQPTQENIVIKYIKNYFIPFIEKTSHREKYKEIIQTEVNNFYEAFKLLLLYRGGYSNELKFPSFNNHFELFVRENIDDFNYQNYLNFQFASEKSIINDFRNLMRSNNKFVDLNFKYQLLTNIDNSTTSISKDEINSSNLVELTQMIVLGRSFMENDTPIVDFITKTNKNEGDKTADDYIFKRPSFKNMVYFEKLIEYLRGDRLNEFNMVHNGKFFNYDYIFPDDAFNIIDVKAEDIPAEDLAIIGDSENGQFSAQLFTENDIFKRTYNLIELIEFPSFKTSSKSYIKETSVIHYPHEMIRKNILTQIEYSESSFSEWLFDTDAPLFVRQLYAVFNSIKSRNEGEIVRELTVLSLLLNPWSNDPSSLILFWNYLNENIGNFVPRGDDEKNKFLRVEQSILKGIRKMKWGHQILEGTVYYLHNHKCIKIPFVYELEHQLDHLIFKIAISNKSCNEYLKYSNMFKSLPYVHLIKEIPIILAFSEFLQKKFVIELDALFVVLSTLNCGELTKIGDEMKGISFYSEIQNCIETNNGLLERNHRFLNQNQIKNLLIKINQIYPEKCAYEQLNLYTHKIVSFYNNCFTYFYSTKPIKFNLVQMSNLFPNFNLNKTYVLSSFMVIRNNNGQESNFAIDMQNFLSQAFSYKTRFRSCQIDMNNIYPKNVKVINYPDDNDFLGFKVGQFANSIFANIDIKEVMLNMEYFIKVEENDPLYKEKCLAMSLKCRPYNDSDPGDAFDALAYLLVMLTRSKEKIPGENSWRFLFYDIVNNNQSRINQVFENLHSLESNVEFNKSRAHIKGQKIIKNVLKRIIPKEIQNNYK